MVVLQDGDLRPVFTAAAAVFFSAFVLGAIMQNWPAALLRPSGENALFKDSTTVAYLVVGFFHFGGMVAGLLILLAGLVLSMSGMPAARGVASVLVVVAAPVSFVVVFAVWTQVTLRELGWDRLWLSTADRPWLLWAGCQGVLVLYAIIRFGVDGLT